MNFPSFVGPAYQSQSPLADSERCINLYPEVMESGGAAQSSALYPCPGFESFSTFPEGPIRGLFAQDGRCFAVVGFKFYEIFSDGTNTEHGEVALDGNPATISSSGDAGGELFITSGDNGYIFTLATDTLSASVLTGVTMGDYLDGYFLALDAATSTLKVSGLLDGLTWDPTQIAQRTQGSDKWQAMKVNYAYIWLWGSQTAEVWQNLGTFPFPFAPVPNGFLTNGTAASFSAANLGTSVLWLQSNTQGDAMVLRSDGLSGVRISTHAVEYAIQGYSEIADAIAMTYQMDGHEFYLLTFPSANVTWVFDTSTNTWHQRGFWNSALNRFDAYRVTFQVPAFNRHLVGDRNTGTVYTMSNTLYTDVDGNGIRRLRACPHIVRDQRQVSYPQMIVLIQTGVGLSGSGQGSDPQCMLRWSNDAGQTWSNELTASIGAQGAYQTRVLFNRLGQARGGRRVFEWSGSDPVPYRLVGAELPGAQVGVS